MGQCDGNDAFRNQQSYHKLSVFPLIIHFFLVDISFSEFVICRMCGSDITLSNYFDNKLSPVAVSVGNHTFHDVPDVLIQELENPFGIKFQVATLKQAHCAITESNVCSII